jgi:hypothetical protein
MQEAIARRFLEREIPDPAVIARESGQTANNPRAYLRDLLAFD